MGVSSFADFGIFGLPKTTSFNGYKPSTLNPKAPPRPPTFVSPKPQILNPDTLRFGSPLGAALHRHQRLGGTCCLLSPEI